MLNTQTEFKAYKRILVIGCSGSGKSTLTSFLSKKLRLPPLYLDTHYWQANWTQPDKTGWLKKITELSAEDSWVMDGTYSESLHIRLPKADKIILIHLPRLRCLYRVVKGCLRASG